jgi:hypothetical protein
MASKSRVKKIANYTRLVLRELRELREFNNHVPNL